MNRIEFKARLGIELASKYLLRPIKGDTGDIENVDYYLELGAECREMSEAFTDGFYGEGL